MKILMAILALIPTLALAQGSPEEFDEWWAVSGAAAASATPAIAHWLMNDNATNTTVIESNGGKNGTAQQNTSVLHVTGKVNGALSFSGADWIQGSLVTTQKVKYSMACWINLPTTSAYGRVIVQGSYALGGYTLAVGNATSAGSGNHLLFLSEGISWYDSGKNIGTNWHHVAIVVTNSTYLRGYIDGSCMWTTTVSAADQPSTYTVIGASIGAYSDPLTAGYVDDVRIYDFGISPAIVSNLYSSGDGSETEP